MDGIDVRKRGRGNFAQFGRKILNGEKIFNSCASAKDHGIHFTNVRTERDKQALITSAGESKSLLKLRGDVWHLFELSRFRLSNLKLAYHAHESLQIHLLGIALQLAAGLEHLVAKLCTAYTHGSKPVTAGGGDP